MYSDEISQVACWVTDLVEMQRVLPVVVAANDGIDFFYDTIF